MTAGISRRGLWAGALGIGALTRPEFVSARQLGAPATKPLARVIIDNDLAGDPDGLIALAYQLVAVTTKTVLVTTSPLDPNLTRMSGTLPVGRTAARGAELARRVLGLARIEEPPRIVAGSETLGAGDEQLSAAARAIATEAGKRDDLPLFVTCGGPLTNVAAALRLDPSIARKMTVVWIGGRSEPAGGQEYNLSTDIAAARQVIEDSEVALWQVPLEAYMLMRMSQAQMLADFRPISPLTRWVYDKLVDLPSFVKPTGLKGIGDVALPSLTAISGDVGRYADVPARRIGADSRYGEIVAGRSIRIYRDLDDGLVIADMLAAFRLNARRG